MNDTPLNPDEPLRPLSDDEWDVLWKKMTSRRIVEMDKKRSNPWDSAGQYKDEYKDEYKEMVVALLGGKESWESWQEQYPHIDFYDFEYLDFFHEINLEEATFSKDAIFAEAKFNQNVNFLQAKFIKGASFPNAIFNEEANFKEAEFFQLSNFAWIEFKKQVDFVDATFTEKADFVNTTFADHANFYKTKFLKEANFLQATFAKYAIFNEAEFSNEANFKQARLQSSGFFDKSKFYGDKIDFNQVILSADSNLIFTGANFYNAVPDFCHLKPAPDIRFHGLNVVKPSSLFAQKKLSKKREWQEDDEDRYRKLKELAINGNNHEYELKFYGYEMDSKLINKKNKLGWKRFRLLTWWQENFPIIPYQIFSNYGQSMLRPFLGVLFLWIVPLIYYCITDDGLLWLNFALLEPDVLFETIKPILPFPIFMNYIDSFGHLITKIIASVFWFLLFLAVRNKFKIK